MYKTDTICAIASAMTNAGIGIIRVSGSDAIEKVDRIYKGKQKLTEVESHTVQYGHIVYDDKVIDEVMVLVLKSPRTYTTEDTVEIDCHGGTLVMQEILKAVIAQGVRPAEPGEFTKRAFLNGRIDLSQAESVMDVISSNSSLALHNSINQLQGIFSDQIKDMRSKIIYEIAYIESALDDPEHIDITGYGEELLPKIQEIIDQISHLLATADNGSMLKEGIKTTIIGKPNAGKSSLLNLLARKDRAIVTDIAGTTRDTLEEQISLNGIFLRIIDTAGIRHTEDVVEKIGVKKAYDTMENADLILYVVDASRPLDENDIAIMEKIKDLKVIVLLNKTDLDPVVDADEIHKYLSQDILPFSAKNGQGLDYLEKMITDMFFTGQIMDSNEVFLTNARHIAALSDANESLKHVVESISMDMPEDFLSIDLMDAYESLGIIIGESVEEDLVNEIFAKFCTGK